MNGSINSAPYGNKRVVVAIAILLGVGATIAAIVLDDLGPKTAFGAAVALLFAVVVLFLANYETITTLSIVLLGLGIPFNLDINLFFRSYVGVTSVDIGVSLLSALALYALFFYDHYTSRHSTSFFRYNRTLFWAPIFYIMSGCLSFANAYSYELTVLELVRLGILFIIFFIIMNLRNQKQVSTFIFTLSVGVVLQAIMAFYQYKTGQAIGLEVVGERGLVGQNIGFEFHRPTGTIGHPNILAYYFGILIPLMLAMLIVEQGRWTKVWYFIALLFGVIGIWTTLSRGGWVGVPFSTTIVLVSLLRGRLTNKKFLVGIFLACVGFSLLFVGLFPTIEKRMNFEDQGSFKARAPLNRAAWSIIKQYPVFGVGMNNLASVFRVYDTTGGSSLFKQDEKSHVVHNMFLGVWSEVGTIGIVAFVWMFIATAIVAIKHFSKGAPWQQGVLVGVVAGMVAQMIHGMVDPGFRILMNVSMLVYSLLGLVGAVSVLSKKEAVSLKG